MTLKESAMLMAILREAYPRFCAGKSEEDAVTAVKLWHEAFADDDKNEVYAAVKAFIAMDTKGFPPVIGQIKARLVQLKNPGMLDEAQAWGLVSQAIKRSAYHAAKEFAKLPPVVRRVVSNPSVLKDWALAPVDTLQTVIASNFQRAYRARVHAEMEALALPSDIRKLLERADPTLALPEPPEPPDPEEQKRKAILMLAESREKTQREILGEEYDKISYTRNPAGTE